MTLQQCYALLGGDYEGVLGRMRKESLVEKFVLKFLNDPSMEALRQGVAAKEQETAFRAAHTIKGVAQNLGFTWLYEASSRLADVLRHSWNEEALALTQQVEAAYQKTVDAILAYREGCSQ